MMGCCKTVKNFSVRLKPFLFMSFVTLCLFFLFWDYVSIEGISKIYNFPYRQPFIHPIGNLQISVSALVIFYSFSFFFIYYFSLEVFFSFVDMVFDSELLKKRREQAKSKTEKESCVCCPILSWFRVYTLRSLLEEKSCTRSDPAVMQKKAKETKAFPTLLAAFSTLFIGIIIQSDKLRGTLLFQIVATLQIISIVIVTIGFPVGLGSGRDRY
jgi:hypothetical protein